MFFLATAIGAYLIGVLPILPRIGRHLSFVSACVTHTGAYGAGPVGFQPGSNLRALLALALGNKLAAGIILLAAAVAISGCLARHVRNNAWFRLLVAITVARCLQVGLAAKGHQPRYAIASMGLIGIDLWLLWQIGGTVFRGSIVGRRFAAASLAAIVAIALALQVRYLIAANVVAKSNCIARQRMRIEAESLREPGQTLVFVGYIASSPIAALHMGNLDAGGGLSTVLSRHYPGEFFTAEKGKRVTGWDGQEIDWEKFLAEHPRVVLHADLQVRALESSTSARLTKISSFGEENNASFEAIYTVEPARPSAESQR